MAWCGRQLTVVPWNWDIKKERYDGLFVSNGPGDPAMCEETVNNLRWAIEQARAPRTSPRRLCAVPAVPVPSLCRPSRTMATTLADAPAVP